ncbi:hypothetical protein L207DRAFT_571450 [Hyaloscypha variabilis F]|uniref:RGS domain-containing protein n=1 Tax=Hyaloscypha variabilis (strain UAMH 11265 / GT02V1 / F) TaxID=1149755 RepID=A0A2J6R3Y3_HYAVF|nr:hypothetical protein L207DRAFT_571450 [Hyaloscypha variabilis F]
MSSFHALLQAILRVLLFRPLPSTSTQVTSTALKTYRSIVQNAGSTFITIPPPVLSFDRILSNEAGYPVSRREFLTYLSDEKHTAENFQFFLFFLNYAELYNVLAVQRAHGLSPPFTEQDEKEVKHAVMAARRASRTSSTPSPTSQSNFTDFGVFTGPSSISSYTPPTSSGCDSSNPELTTSTSTFSANTQLSNEMEHCLTTYIRPHSTRELNLSDLDRALLLQAMQQSNHPDIFRLITKQLEPLLRASYLDFINTVIQCPSSSSINSLAIRIMGPALVISSLLVAVLVTLSNLRYEFRALLVPVLFCGVVTCFCVEREAFVWCGEGVEELLEEGGVGTGKGKGKRKREIRGVVVAQGLWAGVLAAGAFCLLFLLLPRGDKF